MLTASGVLANFGGVPLAFAFIATIGNAGVVTTLSPTGSASTSPMPGLNLYTFGGLVLVYLCFLIPLMVIVVAPHWTG